jgi:hypothetical protein
VHRFSPVAVLVYQKYRKQEGKTQQPEKQQRHTQYQPQSLDATRLDKHALCTPRLNHVGISFSPPVQAQQLVEYHPGSRQVRGPSMSQ